jgi:hypothetical protein
MINMKFFVYSQSIIILVPNIKVFLVIAIFYSINSRR